MLSIVHVGWYRAVLTQPPDQRADTLTDHAASQLRCPKRLKPTDKITRRGLTATVSSISGPPDGRRAGC